MKKTKIFLYSEYSEVVSKLFRFNLQLGDIMKLSFLV